MPLLEEDAAALRADLERLEREVGAGEAANREYEVKLERLRKKSSMGTSFEGPGDGGGSADLWGTVATTMGSMWTRGVSIGGGLRQGLFYLPHSVVPKFPVECPPYVYIAWERRLEVFIANQGLGHTISPDAPQITVIGCVDNAYLFGHFGEALVTEHRRVWGYICEATAGAPFENRLYERHSVSDALRTMRKWALPLHPAERLLLVRGSTIWEGGDTTISSPGRSPKQHLPEIGLHDPLYGPQACPEFITFDQGVGQICPR